MINAYSAGGGSEASFQQCISDRDNCITRKVSHHRGTEGVGEQRKGEESEQRKSLTNTGRALGVRESNTYMLRMDVPHPTSRTTLSLKRCAFWYIAFL